jgi:hypothetical protein
MPVNSKLDLVIAYQTSLTFWTAAFPSLARNTVELRNKADEYNAGTITRDEYDFADMMKRNELSNMSFYIQSVGEIVILAVIVGIMFGVRVNDSEANNVSTKIQPYAQERLSPRLIGCPSCG